MDTSTYLHRDVGYRIPSQTNRAQDMQMTFITPGTINHYHDIIENKTICAGVYFLVFNTCLKSKSKNNCPNVRNSKINFVLLPFLPKVQNNNKNKKIIVFFTLDAIHMYSGVIREGSHSRVRGTALP